MTNQVLQDGSDSFEVTVIEAPSVSPVVLFSVGSGGQPERHRTLLDTLANSGFRVLAPHFDRLTSPRPSEADLLLRGRRLALTLNAFIQPGTTVAGVGHSIGAATLLALAGGQMWLGPDWRINIAQDIRLTRLALLAPPTGFFQAPGSLDAVKVPILAWVGSEDRIAPPSQSEWLAHAFKGRQSVDVRITDGAGHFTFMDQPPPHIADAFPNKEAFLLEHSSEISNFLLG